MVDEITYDGSIEYKGATYVYNAEAANSFAVARAVYKSASDPGGLMDAFEVLFGSYTDEYWRSMASDEDAFTLLAEIYKSERGLKN